MVRALVEASLHYKMRRYRSAPSLTYFGLRSVSVTHIGCAVCVTPYCVLSTEFARILCFFVSHISLRWRMTGYACVDKFYLITIPCQKLNEFGDFQSQFLIGWSICSRQLRFLGLSGGCQYYHSTGSWKLVLILFSAVVSLSILSRSTIIQLLLKILSVRRIFRRWWMPI